MLFSLGSGKTDRVSGTMLTISAEPAVISG
jgi:hypothetical protein